MSSKKNQILEDVAELKTLLKTATRPRVKDLLSIEIRRLETELLALKDESAAPDAPVKTTQTSSTGRYTAEINNYGWDQSDKFVKLFVTLPGVQNVPETQIKVSYDRGVEVFVEDLANKDHRLTIKNLLEPIVAEKSYHKVKTDMVVVYMLKSSPGKRWDYLTATAKKVDSNNKAMDTEGMMDDNPNAALMNIMKKMYETGDPATKQMIEKAYTENMNKSSTIP